MSEDIIITESKRQSVIYLFTILTAISVLWLQGLREDTVARKRAIMWSALAVKRCSDAVASPLAALSAKAATVYNQTREF